MNEKKFRLSAVIMTVVMFVLCVLEKLAGDALYSVNAIINPLLFIATLVCAYLAFKNDVSYESKWLWAVIAVQFSLALGNIAYVPVSVFVTKISFSSYLMIILRTAGAVIVLLSILFKKFVKLLPIGFAIYALDSVIGAFVHRFSPGYFVLLAVNILFVLLTIDCFPSFSESFDLDKLSSHKGVLRTFIVALIVLLAVVYNSYNAIHLIILAFIIAPAGKPKLTQSKIAAFLCTITAVAGVITFIYLDPVSEIERIDDQIYYVENDIDLNLESSLDNQEKNLAEFESLLDYAKETLETKNAELNKAESALNKECSRDSYSYYYCDSSCRSLHYDVEALQDKVSDLKNDITDYEWDINNTKSSIERLKETIDEQYKLLSELQKQRVSALFTTLVNFIAIGLGVSGLAVLAYCLLKSEYGTYGILACILLAGCSLLSILTYIPGYAYWSFDIFNYPFSRFVLNPYFLSVLVTAIFAMLFTKVIEPKTRFRVLIIIAAFLIMTLSAMFGAAVTFAFTLYAAAVICISLILIPVVFTEYNGIAKHIFLSFITLGIWQFIWVYNVTKNLCKVSSSEKRNPRSELFLYIFLPFYSIYWNYKTAEAVEAYGTENGKQFKIDTLCLVFAVICPILSTVIIQDKINQIVGKPE